MENVTVTSKTESRLRNIHCPWCGGTSLKLLGAKGQFKGSVGSTLVRHSCKDCGRDSNLLVTGDDFFPNRGFGLKKEDFNIKFV